MRQSNPPKTYRVKSFGCQMNVYDGERMGELLAEKGITEAPEGEDADLVTDQLAAVIGHEIAHVTANHSADRAMNSDMTRIGINAAAKGVLLGERDRAR